MQTRKSVKFLCNDWLDITESDGTITRQLEEVSSDDLNDFDFVFQLFLQQGDTRFFLRILGPGLAGSFGSSYK